MDKKNKSLIDSQDGDIILNESGTSVSFGWDAGDSTAKNEANSAQENTDDATIQPSAKNDDSLLTGE